MRPTLSMATGNFSSWETSCWYRRPTAHSMTSTRQENVSHRVAAARAVDVVIRSNRTIDWVESNHPDWLGTPLRRELVLGVLRHYFDLAPLITSMLTRSLRKKDSSLMALLLVGAYQLIHLNKPDHAVVDTTVDACIGLKRPWAKGLINGVLRNVEREHRAGKTGVDQSFGHPEWLEQKLRTQYGADTEALLQANNTRAPMTLRINPVQTSTEAYCNQLQHADIAFQRGYLDESLVLETPQPSHTLPGWDQGWVSVQDQATQFAGHLLLEFAPAGHSLRLLDACAAPGGKLFHCQEIIHKRSINAQCTAIELSAGRIATTQEIAQRLQHKVDLRCADATQLDWWDGERYDLILLDAPCSATGTIRRHPDIRVLCAADQIAAHSRLQRELLFNLWSILCPGGTLLYCTCSLLCEENDDVVAELLEIAGADVQVCALDKYMPTGKATRHGWQCLPTDPLTDGFYYAALRKAGDGGTEIAV
ncbi:MAG: 16S rRNA (cytosine(967)-C(5))-methyltransferase RsmB [Pseudomonadota bacterium]